LFRDLRDAGARARIRLTREGAQRLADEEIFFERKVIVDSRLEEASSATEGKK
jgi:hypothetical protein